MADEEQARTAAEAIFRAGLKAVDPVAAMLREATVHDGILQCGPHRLELARYRRIWVIAVGKAAAPMASALESILGERVAGGIVLVKDGHGARFASRRLELLEGSHPILEERNLEATRKILELADTAGPEDLVVVLLSGGASALLEQPVDGVSLEELRETNRRLLASGAPITTVNASRQRLSKVKGGGLLRNIRPAACLTLILSDVLGSPLWAIGSGPTVAALGDDNGDSSLVHIIADNRVMARAALEEATRAGYDAKMLTTFLAGASDGTDGPTSAAGAVVTGHSAERARAQGLRPEQALENQDSYTFFKATGELLQTGPTGTNTNDLIVLLASA